MELLETNNPKSELLKKSMQQRRALEEEVKLLSDRTEKIFTNVIIIGGALALTYLLVRGFTSSRSKAKHRRQRHTEDETTPIADDIRESKAASILSEVGAVLATQATAFLLSLAKEKLTEYLASQASKEVK
jgi:hypothetical protein